jgi:hypothetical protein
MGQEQPQCGKHVVLMHCPSINTLDRGAISEQEHTWDRSTLGVGTCNFQKHFQGISNKHAWYSSSGREGTLIGQGYFQRRNTHWTGAFFYLEYTWGRNNLRA